MTIKLSLTSPIRTEYKKWIYIHTKAAQKLDWIQKVIDQFQIDQIYF